MKTELKNNVDKMLESYMTIEKAFKWEHNLTKHFAAMVLMSKQKTIDTDAIKNAVDIIKSNTSWTSHFRGSYRFMLASLMVSESKQPESIFQKTLQNEQILKDVGFKQGTHMPIAAYTLHKVSEEENPQTIAQRAFEVYSLMKSEHPWLTSSDDYAMSILIAKTGADINRIEALYVELSKHGFSKGNDLQRLSHILALSERDVSALVNDCVLIKRTLKENKLNLYATYYSALGIVAHILHEDNRILNDWIELTHHMNQMKKYKWLGKGMNLMLASALVSYEWLSEDAVSEISKITLGISVETLIAAQTVAIIAASSAAVAASSASS